MSRNIKNSAYRVQVDLLNTESGVAIEQGTLHVINNKLKVHLDGEIKELIILPQPPADGVFFLKAEDGEINWEPFNGENGGEEG